MRTPPDPIHVVHFTHVANLPGIIGAGLQSDAICRARSLTEVEIGSNAIRERRLTLRVGEVGPGGFVGDYVPWYFGPRSPMMFSLNRNNYEFQQGFDEVVYLVSNVPRLVDTGHRWIASDRNAALALANFTDDLTALAEHIDWDVISARYWNDFPDGADLRAAEFLVHERVTWDAIEHIVCKTERTRRSVEELLQRAAHVPRVLVRSDWYF